MAEENNEKNNQDQNKKKDQFATEVASGLPAYPQVIYKDTGEKYSDGSPVMQQIGIAKDPDHHKKLLGQDKNKPDWGK